MSKILFSLLRVLTLLKRLTIVPLVILISIILYIFLICQFLFLFYCSKSYNYLFCSFFGKYKFFRLSWIFLKIFIDRCQNHESLWMNLDEPSPIMWTSHVHHVSSSSSSFALFVHRSPRIRYIVHSSHVDTCVYPLASIHCLWFDMIIKT